MNIVRELITELRTWPIHGESQHPRPLDEVVLLRAAVLAHRLRHRAANVAMRLECAAYELAARRAPAPVQVAASRLAAVEDAATAARVFTLNSPEGRAWLADATRVAPLQAFMSECGDACDETYDDEIGGCGGCSCHISAPCGHCMRRSDEAERAGLL